MLGGQSRTYISVPIPQGATSIVYTVKSSLNSDVGNNIKLAAELTAALSGQITIAKAINMVHLPPSNATIDVYVIPDDNNNISNFISKNDTKWRFYADFSCLSSLGCKRVINVSGDTKSIIIALRNPSAINRIVATVDVVAVISN